jgi:hypothetical protein
MWFLNSIKFGRLDYGWYAGRIKCAHNERVVVVGFDGHKPIIMVNDVR